MSNRRGEYDVGCLSANDCLTARITVTARWFQRLVIELMTSVARISLHALAHLAGYYEHAVLSSIGYADIHPRKEEDIPEFRSPGLIIYFAAQLYRRLIKNHSYQEG